MVEAHPPPRSEGGLEEGPMVTSVIMQHTCISCHIYGKPRIISRGNRSAPAILGLPHPSPFSKPIMPQTRRAFPFEGSDQDYIAFLESQLSVALNQEPSQNLNGSISLPGPLATVPSNSRNSASSREPSGLQPTGSVTASDSQTGDDYQTGRSQRHCSTGSLPVSFQDNLQILYYDPVCNRDIDHPRSAKSTYPPLEQTSKLEPQGIRELRLFIGDITEHGRWAEKKKKLRLCDPETNKKVIKLLCGRPSCPAVCEESDLYPEKYPPGKKELILRGCDYGKLAKQTRLQGNLVINLAKYQQLIFVSLCVVMLETGVPRDVVDWMMRLFISDKAPSTLRRLRAGCTWVNRCVSRLLDRNWGFQSWEMFLLCQYTCLNVRVLLMILVPRPIQQYGRFAFSRNSDDIFAKEIGVPDLSLPIIENGFTPYCIPCFIKVIAGDALKYVEHAYSGILQLIRTVFWIFAIS